jgi:hypothetical protein
MKTLIAIDEQGRYFPLQACPLKGLLKAECCGHPDKINFNEVCKLMLSTTCPVRHRAARLLVTVEDK